MYVKNITEMKKTDNKMENKNCLAWKIQPRDILRQNYKTIQ